MTRARDLSKIVNNKMTVFKYTATASQTTFTGADDNSATLSYNPNSIIVTYNGIVLENVSEYTATNGTSIVLATGATVGSEVNVIAFEDLAYSGVMPTTGGTFSGDVTIDGAFTSKGIDDNADATTINIDTSENVSLDGAPPASSDNGNLTLKGASTLNWTTHQANIATNATFNSAWKYITTNFATLFTQSSGGFRFYTAGSDTAGNNISWNQKVTILNDGKVGIGINTPTAPLHIESPDNSDIMRMTVTGNEMWAIRGESGSGSNDFLGLGIAGGVQAMYWNEAGEVQAPSQPSFYAYPTTVSTSLVGTGAWQVLPFNATGWDIGNNYSTTNKRFTAPVAGRYLFTWMCQLENANTVVWAYLYPSINGSRSQNRAKGLSYADFKMQPNYHTEQGAWIMNLAAGDYIQLEYIASGSAKDFKTESHWSGMLLG